MLSTLRCPWGLVAVACIACGFEDPAAIPATPGDACQTDAADPEALYAAYIQNPAIECATQTSDSDALNTVIYFTGVGWGRDGSECRTMDPFHGGLMIGEARRPVAVTLDISGSLAYCVIGPGSSTEYVVYSLCGILEPAKAGCELLSQMTSIPTQFESCPGGALCP